jgi:hypothetical protein
MVIHLESRSESPDRLYAMYDGSVKFMDKSLSPTRSALFRLVAACGVALRWLSAPDAVTHTTYGRVLRLLMRGRGRS